MFFLRFNSQFVQILNCFYESLHLTFHSFYMYEAPGRFSILDFIIFKNNLYFVFNSSYFGEVAVIHVFAFLFLLMKKKSWIFITLQCSLKCPMFQTRINLSRALLLPSHVPHTMFCYASYEATEHDLDLEINSSSLNQHTTHYPPSHTGMP